MGASNLHSNYGVPHSAQARSRDQRIPCSSIACHWDSKYTMKWVQIHAYVAQHRIESKPKRASYRRRTRGVSLKATDLKSSHQWSVFIWVRFPKAPKTYWFCVALPFSATAPCTCHASPLRRMQTPFQNETIRNFRRFSHRWWKLSMFRGSQLYQFEIFKPSSVLKARRSEKQQWLGLTTVWARRQQRNRSSIRSEASENETLPTSYKISCRSRSTKLIEKYENSKASFSFLYYVELHFVSFR